MLCPDVLPEDAFVRHDLKKARLNKLLSIVEKERAQNDFNRPCLFCRKFANSIFNDLHSISCQISRHFRTTGKDLQCKRKAYFEHLRQNHNFSFGNPDNLVFTDEFLLLIDEKLNRRVCLYCEQHFKDWNALKEHMRKKFHKHLNPYNKVYDKFYVSNYLKGEQAWKLASHEVKTEKSEAQESDDDENWDDWVQAEEEPLKLLCLFCADSLVTLAQLKVHLISEHHVDFDDLTKRSFYAQVKLVNYVRSCQLMAKCLHCQQTFGNKEELDEHYKQTQHLRWPSESLFDKPQYLLPSLMDDDVLRLLVDGEQTDEIVPVIPESDNCASEPLVDYDLLRELD
jgi:hypothetical protein